tara:strand:- start:798 stop:1037 length:240 start_codon:yes stop_codon:yes gene_type:complete
MHAFARSILATSSSDGLAAWQAVVGEFRKTLDDPLAGWPVIACFAGGLAFLWLNIRVARLMLKAFATDHGGPDPVDHAT